VTAGDDDGADKHRSLCAQDAVSKPASRQRQIPNRGNIRSVDQAGVLLIDPKPALRERLGHVEQEDRAHAVVREAFPHLGEKERRETSRMSEETAVKVGGSRILRCAHREGSFVQYAELRERPGGLSQNVRESVKQEPRMTRIRVNRFTQIRLIRG
jgi:hypothetical protein